MEIIAIVNSKGGIAKTTSAVNIASFMAEMSKRVLVIDFDSQGNLTQSLGVKEYNNTIHNCLVKNLPLSNAIVKTDFNIDLIPANINLSNTEGELTGIQGKELRLKNLISDLQIEYDYIIIDCLPSLNILTVNALVGANSILIPMEASIFALQGLGQLIKIIQLVQSGLNLNLKVKGVFLTKVTRTSLTVEFENQLREIFADKLFKTYIHQNIDIVKAQIAGRPINYFNKKCRGYEDYFNLTQEVLSKNG
ncbi:ParA family protein [Clostridium sp.]|uniref:ParA family protein n=1 Tax=Clostridium sp. TaxID=1506 RepID=UPI0026195F95|nr:AAA family ATPase [Clostridium sp.]